MIRYEADAGARRQVLAEALLEAVELLNALAQEGVDLRSLQHDFLERAARAGLNVPHARMRGVLVAAGVGTALGGAFAMLGGPAAMGALIGMAVIVHADLERAIYFDDSQLRLALQALDVLKAQRNQGIEELEKEKRKLSEDDVPPLDLFDADHAPGRRSSEA